jgi:hypothetical protein
MIVECREERWHRAGIVLTVGVDLHDGRETVLLGVAKAEPHGAADAEIEGERRDLGARGTRQACRAVSRPIIHDQHSHPWQCSERLENDRADGL